MNPSIAAGMIAVISVFFSVCGMITVSWYSRRAEINAVDESDDRNLDRQWMLARTAVLEHEIPNLLPHIDSEVTALCVKCRPKNVVKSETGRPSLIMHMPTERRNKWRGLKAAHAASVKWVQLPDQDAHYGTEDKEHTCQPCDRIHESANHRHELALQWKSEADAAALRAEVAGSDPYRIAVLGEPVQVTPLRRDDEDWAILESIKNDPTLTYDERIAALQRFSDYQSDRISRLHMAEQLVKNGLISSGEVRSMFDSMGRPLLGAPFRPVYPDDYDNVLG